MIRKLNPLLAGGASRPRVFLHCPVIALLIVGCLMPWVALAQDEQSDLESSFFLPIPRESRLRLERIEEAASDQRWTDAAQELIALLAGENSEDFLVPLDKGNETTSSSVKSTTLQLVQKLPPNVLEAYQLLVGTQPEALLKEALAENDQRKLAEVARRFLFTTAGEKASIILARKSMDARQWEGALLYLRRLDYKPQQSRRYQDETDLMRAICLREVGQAEEAKTIVARLKDDKALDRLLPSMRVVGSTSPEKILAQLAQAESNNEHPPYAWKMFQGSETRTAPSRGSEPLQEVQWNARMAQSRQQQDEIRGSMQRFQDNRVPVFPAIHPVIVSNQVIFRTPAGLLATDIKSGKVLWKFPWDNLDLDLSEQESDLLGNIFPALGREFERAIWADARSGHLSSDGNRLFYVHDDRPPGDDLGSLLASGGLRSSGGLFSGQENHLYCFDIAREGAILWQLGGATSDEAQAKNQLSEARFLGPPLPIGKDLFVLAGIIDEVRLLCLDAETGRVNWSQQLARQTSSSPNEILESFLQAATPSHKGGILVCPTNSGSIVAVDLSNQTLLWGFQYKEPDRSRPGRRVTSRDQGGDFMALADRWNDGTPLLHQGKVLVTPTDSDFLYCLDLLTGEKLWERPRRDNVALATVEGNLALMIGKTSVSGVDIETGETAWKQADTNLPEQSLPSGYGFRLNGKYYLPTTNNEIIPIHLADGKLDTPIEAVGELGNLVCYKDYVISVSPEFVTAYKQIDALRREVTDRLAKDDNDAEALRMLGKLQKHDGNLAAALVSLQRSMDIEAIEETRTQLVGTGLAALGQDFSKFRDVVEEMERLVNTLDEKMALARLTARGLHAEGKREEALSRYFDFLDLTDEYLSSQSVPNELLIRDFDPDVEVSANRWARGKISQLHDAMTAEEQTQADEAVQERLDMILAAEKADSKELARFVNRFPRFPAATEARVELANVLLDQGLILQGESILRGLMNEDVPPEQMGPLVFKLATGLKKAGLANESAQWFKEISGTYSNVPVDGKRTGRQVAALESWDPVAAAIVREKSIWPYSEATADIEERPSQGFSRVDYPIRLKESNDLAPTDYSLLLDSDANLVIVRDSFGSPIVRIPFTTQSGRKLYQPQIGALHAQQFGHLMLLSLGSELQAFNMMPNLPSEDSSRLIWSADLQNGVAGSNRRTREFDVYTKKANPFAEMQRTARDVTTHKPIGQFSGNHELICYQIGSRIICRDPISGGIYWERDGVELGCELVVTDKYVIAIPEDEEHERGELGTTVKAMVLSADNGELLNTVELPSSDRIWTVRDGVIVSWHTKEMDQTPGLSGHDAATGKRLWTYDYDANNATKGVLLSRKPWLATLDKLGQLQIINIPDGKIVHQKQLPRDGEAVQLKVVESEDQFLLAVYRDINPRPHFRSIPYDNSETLLRGEIYAFDTETGEMAWESPALVHDNYLLEDFQSSGLPVIALVARLHRPDARTPQMNSALEVLLLDKRDGRVLFRREFSELSVTFSLSGDPSDKTILLQLAALEVNLKFDPDQPPVPAPPAATEIDFSYPPPSDKVSP
ncbi:PQQ-binding-like beta-propeller repeat protein [Bremerella alba]|uniref:Outer membrane protein assembly factor BamB n=1 Tax=Bremerella alba TaxID=980252 RepID=A0A7V8V500_9BACT|nr:PQQ-binding-like beta-propeller repeat protein [Bremerella alba]MBA2114834.1 Outer membrane protein assembly factor BamB [Bremerella alba]